MRGHPGGFWSAGVQRPESPRAWVSVRPLSEAPRFSAAFWTYLFSRFCAATALTLLRTTVYYHVYALSGSEAALGAIGLVQFGPVVALTLVGGAVADAYDRLRIMRLAQIPYLAGAALLFAATARGAISVPLLYAAVFTNAITFAFESPARQAFLPSLVPLTDFPRAVTYSSTVMALAFASGPALSGMLIAAADVEAAYAGFGLLVLGNLIGLAFVRPLRSLGDRTPPSLRAVREGLAYVRSNPIVLGCMALDMFAVIFAGATALLPVYAKDILAVGPRGYGLLSSSLEIGALAMALFLLVRPTIDLAGPVLLTAVAVYGLATLGFGLSRVFPLSVALYMTAGAADQVSVVLRSTVVQLTTPDALRGRVSAVNMIFINASNQLGAVESGFLAAATSATFAVVFGGIGCLLVVAFTAWWLPELRGYRISSRAD
jgi:MFS family permease